MAKQLSPSEIAEQLRAMGMPVPEELAQKAANEKSDAIETMLYDKLSSIEDEKKRVTAAEKMREFWTDPAVKSILPLDTTESKKQGRGDTKYDLRSFQFETAEGEWVVKFYSNPHK